MAIITDLSFLLENKGTLDAKQNFKTIAEMKAFDERFLSDTAVCTCNEDGSLYIFNAKNSDDPKTGKWRAVEGSVVDVVEKDNKTSVSSKGVYGELYTTVPKVPMFYKLAEKQDGTEGLIIVADGTLTDGNTQVEEATVNANKADGDLTVYTVGQYMLKIEEVPEHDVTTYMPRTETYTKTEVDEKIGEAECSTTEELEIYGVDDLFGIPDGTKIPEKTLHMELFKKIFQKIIHPTYIDPVLKVVADKVLVEKGVATDVTLTPTFTKNDAGNVNTVTVYKDNVQVDTQATTSVSPYTLSGVNLTTEATYKYEVAYDEGAVKKNNKGDDDRTGIIEAGTIFKEVKVKPVLATYVGVVDNGNVDETNIVANCEKLIRENTTLVKKVSPVFQTVVFATTGTLTSIINQNNYEVLSSFTKTVVSIGGENYNVYALENINVSNFAYTFKF